MLHFLNEVNTNEVNVDEERRAQRRRADDQRAVGDLTGRLRRLEELREEDLQLHQKSMDELKSQLLPELKAIRAQNETQLEIMKAWNSAKGFVKSVQTIGSVMTWVAKIVAVGAALWAAIHYGGGER